MKKIRFILIVILLISGSSLFQSAVAQEKTREEKQRELRLQKEIDDEKKAIAEQKRAQKEAEEAIKDQQVVVEEALKNAQEQLEDVSKHQELMRIYRDRPDFPLFDAKPFVIAPSGDLFTGHWFGMGENERTTWDFTKSVKENSFSRDYTFDVETTVKNVIMSVNGDCKGGEIRIKIIMPNGKTYSDIVIDEFGNLNWRKSFVISEEENKDKAGEWKFQIDANKATGYFKISLQTY